MGLRPNEFAHGGGLINDVDVLIKSAIWTVWDYQGKSNKPALALKLTLVDEENTEHEQYYSAGDANVFVPARDGHNLIPNGDKKEISDSTNVFRLITSMINAGVAVGFKEENVPTGEDWDISWMENWYCHMAREAQPERSGLPKGQQEAGREKTVLVVTKVHSLNGRPKGGAKAAAKGAGAAKGAAPKANGAAAAAAADDLDAKVTDAVLELLAASDGSIPKQKLSQGLFNTFKADPARNSIIAFAFKDEFLRAEGKPWMYDGTTISLG